MSHTASDAEAMTMAGWLVAGVLFVMVLLLAKERPSPKSPPVAPTVIDDSRLEHAIAVWQKTVDVQQHFNQIEMDIRKTALTVILAAIGAAGYVAEKDMRVLVGSVSVPVATVVLAAAALAWWAFYFMDYYWYHRLLKGSVDQGLALERDLKASGIPIELTNCIGKWSHIKLERLTLRSDHKIRIFYWPVLALVVLLAFVSSCIKTPPASETKTDSSGQQKK